MRIIISLLAFLIIAPAVFAYEYSNPFETKQQAYDRQSYNNYNTYKNNNYQAPLGGYHQTLGSTSSGEQYGYSNRNNSQNDYKGNRGNSSYNSWY